MPHCHEITINPADGPVKLVVTATGELTITQHFPDDGEAGCAWQDDDRVTLPPHGACRAEVVGVPGVKGLNAYVRLLQIDERPDIVDAWIAGAREALEAAGYKVEVVLE